MSTRKHNGDARKNAAYALFSALLKAIQQRTLFDEEGD